MVTKTMQYILFTLLTLFLSCSVNVYASPIIPIPTQPSQPTFTPSAPNLDAKAYILMDSLSGKILAENQADTKMAPASLTKLMSMYIISSALKNGQLRLTDNVRISTKAWKTEGSRMFVKVGDEVPVKDLLQGVIVASGNDATVALAEHIAGTEEAFTSMMNEQAKLLGMKNSHFMDSTGLPNDNHYSTARDLAILSQAYIKRFPEHYSYYSEKWFTYNGIKQPNRNRLLWRFQYADGLKTGHTNDAGYCLVASAKKDGMRLVSVVMGAPNDNARTEDSIRLLTYGFRFYETHKLYNAYKPAVEAKVWQGTDAKTAFGFTEDVYVTVPTGQFKRIQMVPKLIQSLKAPIQKGKTYGNLDIVLNNQVITSKPLIALSNNEKGGFIRRAADSIKYNFHRLFSRENDHPNTA